MNFSDFITNRIKARIRELTVAQTIKICETPESHSERALTEALEQIVYDTNIPLNEWTAQERYGLIISYLSAIQGDELSDGLHLSDYIYPNLPYKAPEYSFVNKGELLKVFHLTADYLEAIENLVNAGVVQGYSDKAGAYVIAAMAAQIRKADGDDTSPQEGIENVVQELVQARIQYILNLPVSEFEELHEHWLKANEDMTHIVWIEYSDEGIVCIPAKESEAGFIIPRTFPVNCITSQRFNSIWQ